MDIQGGVSSTCGDKLENSGMSAPTSRRCLLLTRFKYEISCFPWPNYNFFAPNNDPPKTPHHGGDASWDILKEC